MSTDMPDMVWIERDEFLGLMVTADEEPLATAYVNQEVVNDEMDRLMDRMLHYRAQADKAMAKLAEKGMDLNV